MIRFFQTLPANRLELDGEWLENIGDKSFP